jgi:hypothetical protein
MRRPSTNWNVHWGVPVAIGAMTAVSVALAQPQGEAPEREGAKQADAGAYPEVSGLQVRGITLASGYEEGEPVDEAGTFDQGRIYAIIDVANRTGDAAQIRVAWAAEGKRGPKGMALEIPDQARYRTVAMTWATPRDPGAYRIIVRTDEGETLAEKSFRIQR